MRSPKLQRNILKETQTSSQQRTPRRNTKAVPFNGKENLPLYNKINEIEEHPENLTKDKKLQLYEFEYDENDPTEKKRPKKKRQYTRKKKTEDKAVKFNVDFPSLPKKTRQASKQLNTLKSSNEVKDLSVPETRNVPVKNPIPVLPEEEHSQNSTLPDEPIPCLSTPITPEKSTREVKTSSSVVPVVYESTNVDPATQITSPALPVSPTPSTATTADQISPTLDSIVRQLNNNSLKNSHDSFHALSVSTPIAAVYNPNIHSTPKRSLQKIKLSNEEESPNIDNMFGFYDDSLVSDEILSVVNIVHDTTPQKSPSPPLPTVDEIEAMMERTSDSNYSLSSSSLPEFLMDTSLANCTPTTDITDDFTIPSGLSSIITESDVIDDIPVMHYKKEPRRSYHMRRRRVNHVDPISEEEENEETVPTIVKKKKTRKPKQQNKKDEEHFNKLAEDLNSRFREIEKFQLAVE